jgi:hypothetical protein
MAQAGAVILGLSLIITGICLVGDALKLWDLPSDIWGVVIVLLGSGARFVSRASGKADPPDDPPPPPSKPNGTGPMVAILLLFVAGCGGPMGPAAVWAQCAGGAALACVAEAQGDTPEAAINYSGCVAGQAIKCAAPLVAQSNPPDPHASEAVDRVCIEQAASVCHHLAAREAPPATAYESPTCIQEQVATCYQGSPHVR